MVIGKYLKHIQNTVEYANAWKSMAKKYTDSLKFHTFLESFQTETWKRRNYYISDSSCNCCQNFLPLQGIVIVPLQMCETLLKSEQTLQNMTALSCLNLLNIALDTNERGRCIFNFILWKGTVNSAMSHCTSITYCAICLLQKACNLKTGEAQCQSVGEMRLICGDLLVERKQKSASYYVDDTNVVCILLARVMLCGSNSRRVNHRWGAVVRLACGGQQGVWHHLILCVSKRSVDCLCMCVHVLCIRIFLHSGMARLGVTVSFLYTQKRVAHLFAFDCWELVPITIYNCVLCECLGVPWKSTLFTATRFKGPHTGFKWVIH